MNGLWLLRRCALWLWLSSIVDFVVRAPAPRVPKHTFTENVPLASILKFAPQLHPTAFLWSALLFVSTASLTAAYTNATNKMPRPDVDQLDSQIARLRSGGTLTENEVKVLCDKVSIEFCKLLLLCCVGHCSIFAAWITAQLVLLIHPFY